jgi:hypothetical protein
MIFVLPAEEMPSTMLVAEEEPQDQIGIPVAR